MKGRFFTLETDHKALIYVKTKPEFKNNKINAWVEEMQNFKFEIKYIKGEKMEKADELSRVYENKKDCKKSSWDSRIKKIEDQEYWEFNDGEL